MKSPLVFSDSTARRYKWIGTSGATVLFGLTIVPAYSAVNPVPRPTSPPKVKLPTISRVFPLKGSVGTRVTVSGTNLDNAREVRFGNVAVRDLSKSDSNVVATVPQGAPAAAPITVVTSDSQIKSPSFFTVTTTTISSISPSSGGPGTVLTIRGQNLSAITGVKFGSVQVSSFLYRDNQQLTLRVPANVAPGSLPILLVKPGGGERSAQSFQVLNAGAPIISNFVPLSGPVGTPVQVNGTNLSNVSQVRVGNVVANFSVLSNNALRLYVPSGTTGGRISVVSGTQTATSSATFSVTAAATYAIMGRITGSNGSGLAGVQVKASGATLTTPLSTTTDSNGNYVLPRLSPGQYTLTPVADGLRFTPSTKLVSIGSNNVSNINFSAVPVGLLSISGRVLNATGTAGLRGVPVQRLAQNNALLDVTQTNANGDFSFTDLEPGTYIIKAVKDGLSTTPLSHTVILSNSNRTGLLFKVQSSALVVTNDNLPGRKPLMDANGKWIENGRLTGSNRGATAEAGEQSHWGNTPPSASVWYAWQALRDGVATFNSHGSAFDTVLAVYTHEGTPSVATLIPLTSNDDADNRSTSSVSFAVKGGRRYWLAVDGFNGTTGNIALTWSFDGRTSSPNTPAPLNNHWSKAQTLLFPSSSVNGSNINATPETGEPSHASGASGHTVWYKYQPTRNGVASFSANGTVQMVLAAYTGNAVNALLPVERKGSATDNSNLTFSVRAGLTYYVAVDGKSVASNPFDQGNFSLFWSFTDAPQNDDLNLREFIEGPSGSITGSNINATLQNDEPAHADLTGGRSIWYRWKAPANGTVTFDTLGSSFDTLLAVYNKPTATSPISALVPIVANNDINYTTKILSSRVSFPVVANELYFIAVDGYNGASGSVKLNWNNGAPRNNDLSLSEWIGETSGSIAGSNVNATLESGEPSHADLIGGRSIWYRWKAPANGTVTFDTLGSSFDTLLAVYNKPTATSPISALVPIVSNNDIDEVAGIFTSRVTFPVVANELYFVAVDGYNGASGTVKLNWRMTVSTTNSRTQPTVISSARANQETNSIELYFINSLDATSLVEENFSVSCDDKIVQVEQVNQLSHNGVRLYLASDALTEGSCNVTWTQLRKANHHPLADGSITLTAR